MKIIKYCTHVLCTLPLYTDNKVQHLHFLCVNRLPITTFLWSNSKCYKIAQSSPLLTITTHYLMPHHCFVCKTSDQWTIDNKSLLKYEIPLQICNPSNLHYNLIPNLFFSNSFLFINKELGNTLLFCLYFYQASCCMP